MIDFVRLVWLGLSDLVTGVFGLEEMAGVVGIVDMINEIGSTTAEQESFRLALIDVGNVVAFIAVNLAVMNMLPIPALDGGARPLRPAQLRDTSLHPQAHPRALRGLRPRGGHGAPARADGRADVQRYYEADNEIAAYKDLGLIL